MAQKKFTPGNKRTVYKAGAVPLPPEMLQRLRGGLEVAFNELNAFLSMVEAKWGVETYRLTVLEYQKEMQKWHRAAQVSAREIANKVNRDALAALSGSRTVDFSSFRFYANMPQFTEHMSRYVGVDTMYFRVFHDAMREFRPQVKFILLQVLVEAAEKQDEGAFPERYIPQMRYLVNTMPLPPPEGVKPYFAGLSLPNLENILGNIDDLSRAYHHKALLNQPVKRRGRVFAEMRSDILKGKVELSSLKQQNPRRRHLYWKAISEGKQFITFRTTSETDVFGEGQKREIPIPANAWDQTITARLKVWNDLGKAPQWLLLEYGQARYSPKIKTSGFAHSSGNVPANITGEWIKRLEIKWQELVRKVWDEQVKLFNNTPMPPVVEIAPNVSVIQPHYTKVELETLIRVRSPQYGTEYITYNDYLNRKVNNFFQIGDKWVRTTQIEFFRMAGKRKGYIR